MKHIKLIYLITCYIKFNLSDGAVSWKWKKISNKISEHVNRQNIDSGLSPNVYKECDLGNKMNRCLGTMTTLNS